MSKKVILNYDIYPLGCKGDKVELNDKNKKAIEEAGKARMLEEPYYTEIKKQRKQAPKVEESVEAPVEEPVEEPAKEPVEEVAEEATEE